jgi:DNA-directed RNA polymerase II subunit RPB2
MTISHLVHRKAAAAAKEFEMSTAATTAAVKKPRKMAQARSKKSTPMDVTTDDGGSVSVATVANNVAGPANSVAGPATAAATPATAKESHKNKIDVHNYTEEPWTVINSYFRGLHIKRLTEHQIESYNDFVNYQIQKTIAMFNPVHIRSEQDLMPAVGKYALEMYVTCENFNLYRPQIHENTGATKLMFPHEARLRNFTYSSNMTVDLNIKYVVRSGPLLESEQVIYKVLPNIQIGKLPVMLKSSVCILEQHKHISPAVSGECRMDPGGYFIINGSEKTCLGQERAAENIVQCFNVSKNTTKWSFIAEIKSVPDNKCISPKQITLMLSSKNSGFGYGMSLQLPRMKAPIPLFVIFRALGVLSDKAICQYIVLDTDHKHMESILNCLEASINESAEYLNQEDALKYVTGQVMYTPMNMDKETGAKKKRAFATDILNNDLFPHCRTMTQKLYFLGYMTKCLLDCSLGLELTDDRDSFLNKRIDLTGVLMNNLFRNYFNKMIKDLQKQGVREINNGSWRSTEDYCSIFNMTNIYKIVKSTTIENGFKRALATGDFGIKHTNSNKVGVAQVLNRLTYISSLSHLRRVNTPIDKSGKLIPPRKLHSTSWGFLCPAETPEGGSVGVVKNYSYMTHVTTSCNTNALYDFVEPFIVPLDKLTSAELFAPVKLFINGSWVGVPRDALQLYDDLKTKKLKGIINVFTSIVFDYKRKEIRICNDAGRLTRPVLRVKNNELLLNQDIIQQLDEEKLTWDDLLTDCRIDESVIEYIDPAEQNSAMLAMVPADLLNTSNRYTHCEIHPSTIFGILASCIPFPEHNQSPRNTYQCAMGKQAMGMYVTNYDNRMDKTAYVLTYPMRPLVDTRVMNMIQLNQIPSGCQVIVAIMTHTGYNQEDSVLFNQGAIDRGLFTAVIYHTEKDEDKKIHGDEEIRCKPDPTKTKGMKYGNYDKVGVNGVIPENTLVENRDVIIAKVLPIKEARNDHTKVTKFEDHSRCYRTTEETYVDKNYMERNGDGYNFCKVRLRTLRKPIIGDKFSSRHGQKGTIGNIIPECDMPFMANGLRPDIIINPHAIPSRMTIAQLKETVLGKVLLELGLFGDGTSFGNFEIQDICKELQAVGHESHGNEILYNGLTGEQLESSIFMGPVFYQRLKHMVSDKQHSRSIGPMVNLTRQPAEGRSKDGGLRFGEMERDCMCAHGAARFTKGRMYDASDAFSVYVCKKCGLIAAYNDQVHIHYCMTCENRSDFAYVELPYACKLMFQELITMNVAPRILAQ